MPKSACQGLLLLTSFVVCLLSGCGGGGVTGPKTVRVSGTVTLNGEPLEGAEVRFIGPKFTSYGKTNAAGKYELVQGAVPGNNKVCISKFEGNDAIKLDPEGGIDVEQLRTAAASAEADPSGAGAKANAAKIPKELVPVEFSDPERSKLTFAVPDGGSTSADFRL